VVEKCRALFRHVKVPRARRGIMLAARVWLEDRNKRADTG
jgi:hypothetical protein